MSIVSETRTVPAGAVETLRSAMAGRVITPGDPEYDGARRVHYRGIDRRPAAIARAAGAADVARVVTLARANGLELAVRGGGHSLPGYGVSEGGIVLDLSDLRALQIDPQRRTAWAQAGLTAGEYTAAAGAHGLATGFGDTGSVGIGGLTLGGGIGFLVRKHGLTIDDLLAAEVVTADGEIRRVDAETHPDLFWAIRGGGGNFGVATRFRFRLHEVDTVVGGLLILPATPEVIQAFVAEAEEAPEELSVIANVLPAPPLPFLPPEQHGRPVVMATLVYAGAVEAGMRALAPFRSLAPPIADLLRPMRYPELYQLGEGAPDPLAVAARSLFIDTVDRPAGEAIVEHLRASSAPLSVAQLRVLGGAVARVPSGATAFAHRQRSVLAVVVAAYERPEEAAVHERWTDAFAATLRRGAPGRVRQLPGRRGRSGRPCGLPRLDRQPARGDQGALRPDQPLPPKPEHPSARE